MLRLFSKRLGAVSASFSMRNDAFCCAPVAVAAPARLPPTLVAIIYRVVAIIFRALFRASASPDAAYPPIDQRVKGTSIMLRLFIVPLLPRAHRHQKHFQPPLSLPRVARVYELAFPRPRAQGNKGTFNIRNEHVRHPRNETVAVRMAYGDRGAA